MRNNYILIENESISYYFDKNEIDFLKYTNGILTIKLKNSSIFEYISLNKQQWDKLVSALMGTGVVIVDY
ncbi:MAG: hypothetical protein IIZ67_03735 [Bacilli bacterium]|nr:hypothetical protein [Bacilli bacterium]